MNDAYEVKDSGARVQFASGMVRDVTTGKLDWWRLLIGPMARRLVAHVTKGAVKYPDVKPGVPNWTLAAGEEELARFKDSAFRHFVQWMDGDVDEDHAAAIIFNVNGAEYVKAKIAARPLTAAEILEPIGRPVAERLSDILSRQDVSPERKAKVTRAAEILDGWGNR